MTTAGRKPAVNSAATETFATEPITIMRMQGGTRMPIAEAAETTATASSRPVARAQHGRDHGGADRGDVGHRGAGDAGEDVLGHHHRHAEPAPHPAHQRRGQPHQPHARCRRSP